MFYLNPLTLNVFCRGAVLAFCVQTKLLHDGSFVKRHGRGFNIETAVDPVNEISDVFMSVCSVSWLTWNASPIFDSSWGLLCCFEAGRHVQTCKFTSLTFYVYFIGWSTWVDNLIWPWLISPCVILFSSTGYALSVAALPQPPNIRSVQWMTSSGFWSRPYGSM